MDPAAVLAAGQPPPQQAAAAAQQQQQQQQQKQQQSQQQHPLPFRLLPTRPTAWDAAAAAVTLNARLDGCIVPSEASPEGARLAYSHLVVLDDFIDESTRQELLRFLTSPSEGEAAAGAPAAADSAAEQGQQQQQQQQEAEAGPNSSASGAAGPHWEFQLPASKWERRTTDMAGGAPSWGVRPHVLAELARMELPAMREVHARLCKLLPGCDIALLPSDAIQQHGGGGAGGAETQGQQGEQLPPDAAAGAAGEQCQGEGVGAEPAVSGAPGLAPPGPAPPRVDCNAFVANAAVAGDSFAWHVDADPTSFPDPSPWTEVYGDYFNGEPGKPLLASLMLYLNPEWERGWGGETLFLDAATDCGVFVRPRPRRAVLFHQDALHRVSPPSPAAGGRPRFSLVWKLALLPRQGAAAAAAGAGAIARPEWGLPAAFGSAARVDAVMRQLASEGRKRQRGGEGVD